MMRERAEKKLFFTPICSKYTIKHPNNCFDFYFFFLFSYIWTFIELAIKYFWYGGRGGKPQGMTLLSQTNPE